MKKLLESTVFIQAPRSAVWESLPGAETYEDRTSAFGEGSICNGAWGKGETVQFLSPGGMH